MRDFRLMDHPTVCAQEVLDLRFVMMFPLAEPKIQIIRRSWVLHNARAYNAFLEYECSVAEDLVMEASAVVVARYVGLLSQGIRIPYRAGFKSYAVLDVCISHMINVHNLVFSLFTGLTRFGNTCI